MLCFCDLKRLLYKSNRRDSNFLLFHKRDRKCLVAKNALTKENECSIIGDRQKDKMEVIRVQENKNNYDDETIEILILLSKIGQKDKAMFKEKLSSLIRYQPKSEEI